MFQSILVCLDLVSEEEALVARAADLARSNAGRLTFVHAIDERAVRRYARERNVARDAAQTDVTDTARARIAAMIADATEGVEAEVVVDVGYPLAVIEALAPQHSLVMAGADKRRGISHVLFGGTTSRLLRTCKAPVLVIRSDHHHPFKVLLATVALPANHEEAHDALDLRILQVAAEQARLTGGVLHVAHVTETWVPYASLDESMSVYSAGLLERDERRLKDAVAAAGLDLPPEQVHLLEGDPHQQLIDLTVKLDVELVVMGTVARQGIPGLIVGNTAEQLMKALGCSLLALKPAAVIEHLEQARTV